MMISFSRECWADAGDDQRRSRPSIRGGRANRRFISKDREKKRIAPGQRLSQDENEINHPMKSVAAKAKHAVVSMKQAVILDACFSLHTAYSILLTPGHTAKGL